MRRRSNGGIYCIIPIGKLYDESIAQSVRWRLRKYLGVSIKNLSNKDLNELIMTFIVSKIEGVFATEHGTGYKGVPAYKKNSSGVIVPVSKRAIEFFERVEKEISMSFGYAVYHNGKQVAKDFVPFSKGQYSYSGPDSGSQADLDDFFRVNSKKSNLKSALNRDGWAVMLAVTHYMAARTEATGAYPDHKYPGYGQMVMMDLAMEAAHAIRTALGRTSFGGLQYGYILSRRGYEGKQYRVI